MKTIYEIRCLLCLTQAELAELLGKGRRTIQRWEADEVSLDLAAVKREARLQGCAIPGDKGFSFKPIR